MLSITLYHKNCQKPLYNNDIIKYVNIFFGFLCGSQAEIAILVSNINGEDEHSMQEQVNGSLLPLGKENCGRKCGGREGE